MLKQQLIDYFKLFKIYDLKKLQKTGLVKIIQDKILLRKILCVEGTVSTQNFTIFDCSHHPIINFRQQYLYLLAYCQPGKAFTFQITYFLSNKQQRVICSTMYKQEFKRKGDTLFHFQLKMPSDKWTVLALDLYSLVNWDNSFKNDQDIRIGFRISTIQIRANSKIRGMYQSESLFGPHNLPKDMELPLRGEETFFGKYAYLVTGLNITEQLGNQIQAYKDKIYKKTQIQGKQKVKASKKQVKPDNIKPDLTQDDSNSTNKFQKKNISKQKGSRQKTKQEKSSSIQKNKYINQNQKKVKKTSEPNLEQTHVQKNEDDLIQEQVLQPPKPASSIRIKMQAVEALSVVHQNIISCQSFLIQPVLLQTHKKIVKLYKSRLGKVLTGYIDGSVCLWDTIRKQALFYFKSELQQIKSLIMDYEGNIIIVGLDKLRREVIQIVSDQAIIFKQISNFNIRGIKLISQETFLMGLISFGYENIRIWTISPNNNIINGYSVYLGKMARNVTYNDCCIVQSVAGTYAFICDSSGYVTKIKINEKKMQGVVKVDSCGLDHIKIIKYINNEQKILVINDKGMIKLLSCVNMDPELQYPVNYRIKSLFLKQSTQNEQVPILQLQTYKKTLAQLNLIDSTLHFSIRSHNQQINEIQYQKTVNKVSFSHQDRIVTTGADSTMRIWKIIQVSQQQSVLKQQYQFLINGQTITHICLTPGSKKNNQFVYMMTERNKIRKVSCCNYQIIKEKQLPSVGDNSSNNILSLSINQQGKFLLLVFQNHVLLLDEELQVLHFKDLNQDKNTNSSHKSNKQRAKFASGFNTYKKSLFYQNPITNSIQFYHMKDLHKPAFQIQTELNEKFLSLQWNNEMIHCLTQNQYQLYETDNLLKVIPIQINQHPKNHIEQLFTTMNYPVICKSYLIKQTGQSFIQIQVLNKNGLIQKIRMPERISCIKISKPIKLDMNVNYNDWAGQIVCSGTQSYGLYLLKYTILNIADNVLTSNDEYFDVQVNPISFMERTETRKNITSHMQTSNLSFIGNLKRQNALDISFSQTTTVLYGKNQLNFQNKWNNNKQEQNAPTKLKKLYEQQEKLFQQYKRGVFGNFFDENQNSIQIQGNQETNNDQEQEQSFQPGRIKVKVFFGIESRQSLIWQKDMQSRNKCLGSKYQVGQFYWRSESKIISLLTNQYKSLLVHEFKQPSIDHRLIHLYSKPTSLCWSYDYQGGENAIQRMNYLVVCVNSIVKLYNANNKMSYIRTVELDLLIKDKHVIFNSFITNCNSFLVVLTYRLKQQKQSRQKQDKKKPQQNKLYIFVVDISAGKVISSSYRDVKQLRTYKNGSDLDKSIRQTYSLQVNRFTANKTLQFVLKGCNQLAFYRVTSMFTLQTLQLEQIYDVTKEKTQGLSTCKYVKIQGDVFLLVGTQNGSLIIIDSRSGSIVLVLMNLLYGSKGSSANSPGISKIEFVQQNQLNTPSKLAFFTQQSNNVQIIILDQGLNTLVQLMQPNKSIQQHPSKPSPQVITLDSQITSISTLNRTQQLILTRSSTLWLVDYADLCSIKIFSAHQQKVNQAIILRSNPQNNAQKSTQQFISCCDGGHVKITDLNNIEQVLQIYKPRKKASALQIQGKYTVAAFNDQIYFYDSLQQNNKGLAYLGSLQFQNQNIIQIKNIALSDNYYVVTQNKLYIIYVKRKEPNKRSGLSRSQLSVTSQASRNDGQNSQTPELSIGKKLIQRVSIQIQIQQITSFGGIQQSGINSWVRPIWLQVNVYRPYDEFAIGFRGGKIQTWQRKCLKRSLNPLQQLSFVQKLQYYLMDVYNRKQAVQPLVQFITESQYMVSLSELNKIQIRNYKQHSITGEINFNRQSIQGISTFKYLLNYCKSQIRNNHVSRDNRSTKGENHTPKNHFVNIKKAPLILIGDHLGYLAVCDINGLVIQKDKIFNSPIESIDIQSQILTNNILLKSKHYLSFLQIYN